MARPKKSRRICCNPEAYYFKPMGIPLCQLEEIPLSLDEVEALSLADCEGLYHEEAALRMKISRATFGRILRDARRKVAASIIQGKAIRIETPKGKENKR